jgi:hypothetical protein
MRKTLLTAALMVGFAGSAFAANPQAAPFSLKLDAVHAAGPGAGVVNTDIAAPADVASATLGASAASNASLTLAVPTTLGVSAQAAAGVPVIPGSVASPVSTQTTTAIATPTPGASSVVPSPAGTAAQPSSDAAPMALAPAAASGIAPGVPVKVYSTLAEAAKAGVDPLGERKATAPVAQTPVARGFDWKNPQAYLAFAKHHQSDVLQGGLGLLVALLILAVIRRRRG